MRVLYSQLGLKVSAEQMCEAGAVSPGFKACAVLARAHGSRTIPTGNQKNMQVRDGISFGTDCDHRAVIASR